MVVILKKQDTEKKKEHMRDKNHNYGVYYNKEYDGKRRFISYYVQTKLVSELEVEKILEVGIGNKTVSNYLKQHDYKVTTCDFEKGLDPDVVADIRKLPFRDDSFDLILACEILEHIPYSEVPSALNELARVSKKLVIISIPYSTIYVNINFISNILKKVLNKDEKNVLLSLPCFFLKFYPDGFHYWEMGTKNFPKKNIDQLMNEKFDKIKEYREGLDPYHIYFVLKKKGL